MIKSILILLILIPGLLVAQQVVVRGTVTDDKGEVLPQAHIIIFPDSSFNISDSQGKFSVRASPGNKQVQISFVGHAIFSKSISLKKDTTLTILLRSQAKRLGEVVISSTLDIHDEIFNDNQTSKHVLTQNDINAIPVLGGEADVIKTLQLLPGTVRGIEGSSDLFVRGGAADQNLVLLDDAPIYNTSHLFGFLSVFNPDILDRVEAINGGFPAEYGGRLSSILNVNTK